jgi:hypothetical protein
LSANTHNTVTVYSRYETCVNWKPSSKPSSDDLSDPESDLIFIDYFVGLGCVMPLVCNPTASGYNVSG